MEQIKARIRKAFEKSPKYELVEMPYIDCSEEPVRPELDLAFRQAYGRKIYGLKDDVGEIAAIMCFAFTNEVPKTIEEMETFDIDNPMWSAVTSYIEATTNAPLNRLYNKTQNVRESLDNQHTAFERALLFSGWS